MNYILFDGDVRNALLPFTYTKPVADIRIGILTIRETINLVTTWYKIFYDKKLATKVTILRF